MRYAGASAIAVGFDLGALMTIGQAEGLCLPGLAALLPSLEAGAIHGLAETRGEGGSDDD